MLTPEIAKDLFAYNPETGVVTRRMEAWENCRHPKPLVVGSMNGDGYLQVQFDKRKYKLHRLAWMLAYGVEPTGQIDHINGIRTDNRLENLRVVDQKTNAQNQRKASRNSKSGFLGVNIQKGRAYAVIWTDGRTKALGGYATAEEAHAAYVDAKRRLHAGCTL